MSLIISPPYKCQNGVTFNSCGSCFFNKKLSQLTSLLVVATKSNQSPILNQQQFNCKQKKKQKKQKKGRKKEKKP
jgi:hypothetical protein